MTHPVEQIQDAFADRVLAYVESKGRKVYRHRRLTLDPEQDELPAYSFDIGEDNPIQSPLAGVYSEISIGVAALFAGPVEQDVKAAAIDMRLKCEDVADIERLAPSGQKLGLTFVHAVRWGGAGDLDVNTNGRIFVAVYPFTWIFQYRMR